MHSSRKIEVTYALRDKNPTYFVGFMSFTMGHEAWINGELFENWLKISYHKITRQKYKFIYIIDKSKLRNHFILGVKNVEFIPPNKNYNLQRLDKIIINKLKIKNRHEVVTKFMRKLMN